MKREIKRGVKIVISRTGQRKVKLPYYMWWTMLYERGKWSYRLEEHGPLAVFESAEFAVGFVKPVGVNRTMYEWWECLYIPSQDSGLWTPLSSSICRFAPEGTVFADAVKLIRKVKF